VFKISLNRVKYLDTVENELVTPYVLQLLDSLFDLQAHKGK